MRIKSPTFPVIGGGLPPFMSPAARWLSWMSGATVGSGDVRRLASYLRHTTSSRVEHLAFNGLGSV